MKRGLAGPREAAIRAKPTGDPLDHYEELTDGERYDADVALGEMRAACGRTTSQEERRKIFRASLLERRVQKGYRWRRRFAGAAQE